MYRKLLARSLLVAVLAAGGAPTLEAKSLLSGLTPTALPIAPPPVNCSVTDCTAEDQQLIGGNRLFDESNFDPVFDDLGRARRFWVHIPEQYDLDTEREFGIPTIFAFHGFGLDRDHMVNGKWEDYFDKGVAFVIPDGEPNPCANLGPYRSWTAPVPVPAITPADVNCEPAAEPSDYPFPFSFLGNVSYWDATMPGSFTDVNFVETLLEMVIERFPKLASGKKYATGFSNGGLLTYMLLCYRSGLFDGYSTSGMTLLGYPQRGDLFAFDGVDATDPNSIASTCGKSILDGGHATGLTIPHRWGSGLRLRSLLEYPFFEFVRVTRPIAVFAGENDVFTPVAEVDASNDMILTRNNLNDSADELDPYLDTDTTDSATTRRRIYAQRADLSQIHSAYAEYLVQGDGAAGHAMPDTDVCTATCDYDYTTETLRFFVNHAGLRAVEILIELIDLDLIDPDLVDYDPRRLDLRP